MANRNWLSNKMYQMQAYPCLVTVSFVVDNTLPNGVNFVKGGGVKAVYMNTTGTPSATNPNPEPGIVMIELQDSYERLLGGFAQVASPLDGATTTSTVAGQLCVIVSLGTATLAQWRAAGVPAGVTPAVGVAFVPLVSGVIGGSAAVQGMGTSGVSHIEACGNGNLSINRKDSAVNGGGIVYMQALDSTGAKVAPALNSVVVASIYLSNSSVTVQGL
jgi:hypothetical protein